MVQRRDFGFGLAALAAGATLPSCMAARPEIAGGFVGANAERGHVLRQPLADVLSRYPLATDNPRRTRIVIAGGGVAGLAAARALRLRGMNDFALLELEDSAGGNSRSHRIAGMACPLGAHYLPVPGDSAPDVQNLLETLGLRQRVNGRWQYDERHLCHSPQERLYYQGQWQDGLLPTADIDAATLGDYRDFAAAVGRLARAAPFHMPVSNASSQALVPIHAALDAMVFETWLNQQQLARSPQLRWYLNYCCLDDYGAGIDSVSAWAGIHYFASRHGFHAPDYGDSNSSNDESGILTWPEGNGWLTQQLAAPLLANSQLHTGRTVLRIAAGRHGVEIDALHHHPASGEIRRERWLAEQCIVALPLFIAARTVENPPPALKPATSVLRYAPWLVANVQLASALQDAQAGAAPSWDNVIYGAGGNPANSNSKAPSDAVSLPGLGYVDARHQLLQPAQAPGKTVLTYYRAFGLSSTARGALYAKPWSHWRDSVIAELAIPHPDLPAKVAQMDVVRYGHAMSSPVPGIRSHAALRFLQQSAFNSGSERLHFAHSDLSGYSVFEEAFTCGHRVGTRLGL